MDDFVPVVEQLEQLGRFGGELQRHAEHECQLEGTRHVRAAETRDAERNERNDKAFEGDDRATRVVRDQLADGEAE
jgi:hypothetical protein